MEAVLEVTKKNISNPKIKRLEIEYGDMNYILVNLTEKVIDVDGKLWEYSLNDDENKKLEDMIWFFKDLDEYEYWPDKSKDHAPMSPMWRITFYDEFDVYHHKSGALTMSNELENLINVLKELK